MLGNGCQNVQRESGSVGLVTSGEVCPAIHDLRNESHVARESIEFSDNQRCPRPLGMGKGLCQFRPVGPLARFSLLIRGKKAAGVFHPVGVQGGQLGFHAKTGFLLLLRRNAKVGD
jgi:hypothetical protein